MPVSRRRALLTACLALAAAALAGCSSGGSSSSGTAAFQGATFPPGLQAHDFTLADALTGRPVSLKASAGSVRVLAFLSPEQRTSVLVGQQIKGALDELGRSAAAVKVLVLCADLRPQACSRARAEGLLGNTLLTSRATVLTGTPARLRSVLKSYAVPPASAGERTYLSSTPVILVDGAGRERLGFPVEQLTPEVLAHDIRALMP